MSRSAGCMRFVRRCFALFLVAAFAGGAEAAPTPDRTIQVEGAYPREFFELPDGRLAFVTSPAAGNGVVLHSVSPAGPSVIARLKSDRAPFALNEDFMLVRDGLFFEVHDARSGRRLKRKRFERFAPPGPGAGNYWLDGNVLTLIVTDDYSLSSMRRIELPELKVTALAEAPVGGAVARWKDGFVSVGNLRKDPNKPWHPAITVLDSDFNIVAHNDIEPGPTRNNMSCSWRQFARPHVMGDLLVYGSGCGGIRVHDLRTMRQVAARGPVEEAISLTFASENGRLLAFGEDELGFTVNEISLPSLRPARLLRLPRSDVRVAGGNVYSFASNRPIEVEVYGLGKRAASRSLPDSIVDAQRAAVKVLQDTNDVYAAIASMRPEIPHLAPTDVPALTPAARRALAWYSGLLIQTVSHSQEAKQLLDALRTASPEDLEILLLHAAARTWSATLSPPRVAPTLPFTRSTLTTGALRFPIAQTERYVVAARWCGTSEQWHLRSDTAPDYTDDFRALRACHFGETGPAVHDAKDLRFVRFIPITLSDPDDQDAIEAVAILGDTAFAAISRRYTEKNAPGLIAVDLRSGKVLVQSIHEVSPRVISGSLFGCGTSTCTEMDPATLEMRGTQIAAPDSSMPDSVLEQLTSGTLTTFMDDIVAVGPTQVIALASTRRLVRVDKSDGVARTVDLAEGSANGFGWPSPDGRNAFVAYADRTGPQLVRINFETGKSTILIDGMVGSLAPPVAGNPFLFSWRDGLLEVRDADSGTFVCAWPGLLGEKAHFAGFVVNPPNNTLTVVSTVVGTVRSPDEVTPSAMLDVGTLTSRSQDCARRTASARAALDRSMRALAQPR